MKRIMSKNTAKDRVVIDICEIVKNLGNKGILNTTIVTRRIGSNGAIYINVWKA